MLEVDNYSFFEKIQYALQNKTPFVMYRLPGDNLLKAFIQRTNILHTTDNFNEAGFVFAPFDADKKTVIFPLLESDCFYSEIAIGNEVDSSKTKKLLDDVGPKEDHMDLVEKGIEFLKATQSKKVVLSRKQVIKHLNSDAVKTFKRLIVNYPAAMAYCWYHPKVGMWLGATPETLLKVNNDLFTTMALAGTQLYKGTLDVNWERKEKEEQQYVTDYIVKKLSAITNNLKISETETVKAGSLVHLRTFISGIISKGLPLQNLIRTLHPTPAICGLPKDEAYNFIIDNEGYNRSFYTGFLGELHLKNTSNLFVNLRCMELKKESVSVYVGGGITLDSDPEKEWEETVAKSKVMLSVLT